MPVKKMNNFIIIGFVIIVSLLYSCKKCITCSTKCYQCVYAVPYQGKDSGVVCSDQVGSIDSFNAVLHILVTSRGDRCYKINPSQSYKYCENNKAFIRAVQDVGYECK